MRKLKKTKLCTGTAKLLCKDLSCEKCYSKRLSNHDKSIHYSKKNKKDSKYININAKTRCLFTCVTCKKDYRLAVTTFIKKVNFQWCRKCPNKTELKLHGWLNKIYGSIGINKHVKFDWCKNKETNRYLPFDFVIESMKLIIELDGKFHFSPIRRWKQNIKQIRERDKFKMECAIKNGYTLIRILQDDVWYDKNNWTKHLIGSIKYYLEPQKVFICSNNEYCVFL